MNKADLFIQNLRCGGCDSTITSALRNIEGVTNVEVLLAENQVRFNYSSQVQFDQAINKLETLGYPLEGNKNHLGTKLKSIGSCAIGKLKK